MYILYNIWKKMNPITNKQFSIFLFLCTFFNNKIITKNTQNLNYKVQR